MTLKCNFIFTNNFNQNQQEQQISSVVSKPSLLQLKCLADRIMAEWHFISHRCKRVTFQWQLTFFEIEIGHLWGFLRSQGFSCIEIFLAAARTNFCPAKAVFDWFMWFMSDVNDCCACHSAHVDWGRESRANWLMMNKMQRTVDCFDVIVR